MASSSRNVRNSKQPSLGNQIEEDEVSVICMGKKRNTFTIFWCIIEGNGSPNGITVPRRQNANTIRKEVL